MQARWTNPGIGKAQPSQQPEDRFRHLIIMESLIFSHSESDVDLAKELLFLNEHMHDCFYTRYGAIALGLADISAKEEENAESHPVRMLNWKYL